MNNTSRIALAAVVGAVVGGVVALMLAPQSGRETRDQLGSNLLSSLDDLLAAVENRISRAGQTAEEVETEDVVEHS